MKRVMRKWVNAPTALAIGTILFSILTWLGGYDLRGTPWHYALLLGVGILASTFGITKEAITKQGWRLVLWAVTVGVFTKALIIGGLLWGISSDTKYFVMGLLVAQIDPLAVAALSAKSRLSKMGDGILRAWSTLDDPVTVVGAILLFTLQGAFGIYLGLTFVNVTVDGPASFGQYMLYNIAFVGTVTWCWQYAYRGPFWMKIAFTVLFIAGSVIIASVWFWMFGLALIGLCMRPKEAKIYDVAQKVLNVLSMVALAVLGVMVIHLFLAQEEFSRDIAWGFALGAAAFLSQIIVTVPLTRNRGLSRQDRFYLAFGHQNGITALLLGVSTGTIAFIVPAIIMTQMLRLISTVVLDRCFAPASAT